MQWKFSNGIEISKQTTVAEGHSMTSTVELVVTSDLHHQQVICTTEFHLSSANENEARNRPFIRAVSSKILVYCELYSCLLDWFICSKLLYNLQELKSDPHNQVLINTRTTKHKQPSNPFTLLLAKIITNCFGV